MLFWKIPSQNLQSGVSGWFNKVNKLNISCFVELHTWEYENDENDDANTWNTAGKLLAQQEVKY